MVRGLSRAHCSAMEGFEGKYKGIVLDLGKDRSQVREGHHMVRMTKEKIADDSRL